jgi:hypothetical protein
MEDESEQQNVWRCVSKTATSGIFVWEVMDVIGTEKDKQKTYFERTLDGGAILIYCYHFWTVDQAKHCFSNDFVEFQIFNMIGEL